MNPLVRDRRILVPPGYAERECFVVSGSTVRKRENLHMHDFVIRRRFQKAWLYTLLATIRSVSALRRALSRPFGLVLAVCLAGCGGPPPSSQAPGGGSDDAMRVVQAHGFERQPDELIAADPALAVVRGFGLRSDFIAVTRATGLQRPEFPQLVEVAGSRAAVEARLDAFLLPVAEEYSTLFEGHFAFALGELLDLDQLRSLAVLGLQSPYRDDLLRVRVEAGRRALEYNGNLHESVAQGALTNAIHLPPGTLIR